MTEAGFWRNATYRSSVVHFWRSVRLAGELWWFSNCGLVAKTAPSEGAGDERQCQRCARSLAAWRRVEDAMPEVDA